MYISSGSLSEPSATFTNLYTMPAKRDQPSGLKAFQAAQREAKAAAAARSPASAARKKPTAAQPPPARSPTPSESEEESAPSIPSSDSESEASQPDWVPANLHCLTCAKNGHDCVFSPEGKANRPCRWCAVAKIKCHPLPAVSHLAYAFYTNSTTQVDADERRKEIVKMLHIHEKLVEASKTAYLPASLRAGLTHTVADKISDLEQAVAVPGVLVRGDWRGGDRPPVQHKKKA